MTILIDLRGYAGRPSGTRRLMFGLARELAIRLGESLHCLVDQDEDELAGLEGATCSRWRGPSGWKRLTSRRRYPASPALVIQSQPAPDLPAARRVLVLDRTPGTKDWLVPSAAVRGAECVVMRDAKGAERLLSRVPKLESRLHVIDQGVDLARFGHGPASPLSAVPRRYGLAPRGYILCVGALDGAHGTETALALRFESAERGLDYPLVLVGQGELLPEVELMISGVRYPAQRMGTVLRGVGDSALAALYAEARIVLAPAPHTSAGLVPLEALAAGAPVIASDLDEVRSRLDGTPARLVPPLDLEAWRRAMHTELFEERTDPEDLQRGQRQARALGFSRLIQPFVEDLLARAEGAQPAVRK